jgi:adenosylcobinamide-phosphate synthase
MVVAMAIDAVLGWPERLFRLVGHPVTWLGRLIDVLDRACNRDSDAPMSRRAAGIVATLLAIAVPTFFAWTIQAQLGAGWGRIFVIGILAWPLVALRALHDHVAAVARPLQSGDIKAARMAVSRIVGRDPLTLDDAGIARASIESLAENASDGVVAPMFWGAIFGLPGIVGYKVINTLDSMIGHRTPRHEAFGWAAARIDDVANFIPARLTGVLFALLCAEFRSSCTTSAPTFHELRKVMGTGKLMILVPLLHLKFLDGIRRLRRGNFKWAAPVAMRCMICDGPRHRSVNAGWPEAAMAGALGVRLSGPRIYHGEVADEPWLNAGARDPGAGDIGHALKLFRHAMLLLAFALILLALA